MSNGKTCGRGQKTLRGSHCGVPTKSFPWGRGDMVRPFEGELCFWPGGLVPSCQLWVPVVLPPFQCPALAAAASGSPLSPEGAPREGNSEGWNYLGALIFRALVLSSLSLPTPQSSLHGHPQAHGVPTTGSEGRTEHCSKAGCSSTPTAFHADGGGTV